MPSFAFFDISVHPMLSSVLVDRGSTIVITQCGWRPDVIENKYQRTGCTLIQFVSAERAAAIFLGEDKPMDYDEIATDGYGGGSSGDSPPGLSCGGCITLIIVIIVIMYILHRCG